MHLPRFQLGKLDKNESARSLALQFGRLKKIVWWLGGWGQLPPLAPPLATAVINNSNTEQKSPTYSYNSQGQLQKPQYMIMLIYMGCISEDATFMQCYFTRYTVTYTTGLKYYKKYLVVLQWEKTMTNFLQNFILGHYGLSIL